MAHKLLQLLNEVEQKGATDNETHVVSLNIAEVREIMKMDAALLGIINHWREFGEMMITNKDDYGLSERIDAAAELIRE